MPRDTLQIGDHEWAQSTLAEVVRGVREENQKGAVLIDCGTSGWFRCYLSASMPSKRFGFRAIAMKDLNAKTFGGNPFQFERTYKRCVRLRELAEEATNALLHLGFRKMATTVIAADMGEHGRNSISGSKKSGGHSSTSSHVIRIERDYLPVLSPPGMRAHDDRALRLIIHEWAHNYYKRLPKASKNHIREFWEHNIVKPVRGQLVTKAANSQTVKNAHGHAIFALAVRLATQANSALEKVKAKNGMSITNWTTLAANIARARREAGKYPGDILRTTALITSLLFDHDKVLKPVTWVIPARRLSGTQEAKTVQGSAKWDRGGIQFTPDSEEDRERYGMHIVGTDNAAARTVIEWDKHPELAREADKLVADAQAGALKALDMAALKSVLESTFDQWPAILAPRPRSASGYAPDVSKEDAEILLGLRDSSIIAHYMAAAIDESVRKGLWGNGFDSVLHAAFRSILPLRDYVAKHKKHADNVLQSKDGRDLRVKMVAASGLGTDSIAAYGTANPNEWFAVLIEKAVTKPEDLSPKAKEIMRNMISWTAQA